MYSEVFASKKSSFLIILILVTGAFCLLSVPSWIRWESFVWIYELAVLLLTAFAVYALIRHRFYEYTYIINEDIIAVRLKIGSKESVVCRLYLRDILKVSADAKIGSIRKDDGVRIISRCNGDIFGAAGTCIIYNDEESGEKSALIFRPSEKFTEILQNKRIDNHE